MPGRDTNPSPSATICTLAIPLLRFTCKVILLSREPGHQTPRILPAQADITSPRPPAPTARSGLGTHQGGIAVRHIDFYLDEFVFRFNRRGSGSRGLLFYRLIEQAITADPKPAATAIIGGVP